MCSLDSTLVTDTIIKEARKEILYMYAPSLRNRMERSFLYKMTGGYRLRRCWGIITLGLAV